MGWLLVTYLAKLPTNQAQNLTFDSNHGAIEIHIHGPLVLATVMETCTGVIDGK